MRKISLTSIDLDCAFAGFTGMLVVPADQGRAPIFVLFCAAQHHRPEFSSPAAGMHDCSPVLFRFMYRRAQPRLAKAAIEIFILALLLDRGTNCICFATHIGRACVCTRVWSVACPVSVSAVD